MTKALRMKTDEVVALTKEVVEGQMGIRLLRVAERTDLRHDLGSILPLALEHADLLGQTVALRLQVLPTLDEVVGRVMQDPPLAVLVCHEPGTPAGTASITAPLRNRRSNPPKNLPPSVNARL